MKNLLKKLHIMSNPNQSEEIVSHNNNNNKSIEASSSRSHHSTSNTSSTSTGAHDHNKPMSGLSGWLNSISNRHSSNLSVSTRGGERERAEALDAASVGSGTGLADVAAAEPPPNRDSGSSNSRDPDVEEEYQIQLALELSAREDPEAVQIEAVKQISLGTCAPTNTPAEVAAYRYWNYNVLGYDDKILDGFYDLYGILNDSAAERMPSLIDLQGTPVSGNVTWEAVLVNKAGDSNLLKLEQIALEMALKSRPGSLVQKLAVLVSDYMGGPVGNPENMLREWQNLTLQLRATIGSMVLPLGSLKVGLARHRALLFKVLADSVNIPCRLVKGQKYTGSTDVAMNFVKLNDGREYIVDLMSDPGTLIPSDAAGSHIEYDESFSTSPMSRDIDSSRAASSSSWVGSSSEDHSDFGASEKRPKSRIPQPIDEKEEKQPGQFEVEAEAKMPSDELRRDSNPEKGLGRDFSPKANYTYAHARSPSWTEGVSSPAVRKKKVKDVSKYMIDAAKENPRLAQKLHDVLLESGVVAPPNLFTEAYPEQLDVTTSEEPRESRETPPPPPLPPAPPACFLPPLPHPRAAHHMRVVENLAGHIISTQAEISPMKYGKNVPVAAAAAAAAAVVASSMVVAAAKSSSDPKLDLPVAAAATATAAAVVATTAAVTKQYEQGMRSDGNTDSGGHEPPRGSGDREHEASECERISDKSVGNESTMSDTMESVADCEILWEDITIGDRIGLGSYGEVYRGEWHGTEVAVKRFLDQDITGESLAEFIKEVQIMKKLRHPNVVLFMGAVTRPPNLSIVTEFLPRGSLYRLLHRPNNQLDERRRLRMALDAARGMNYLHSSSPVIVHRDLKSPNLLVDKNWVVKVCDFGLSKMKHSTFLSSRSTAGTAEWMAPEVLQNEPSDEKCDVYSFGVILWELSTMQQPWNGMNPMQVVGAVGFQHRRLDIPDNVDPTVADIIRRCWQADPKLRPSFAEIMASLKPLQRPINHSSQVPRPNAMSRERVQPSRIAEESAD